MFQYFHDAKLMLFYLSAKSFHPSKMFYLPIFIFIYIIFLEMGKFVDKLLRYAFVL